MSPIFDRLTEVHLIVCAYVRVEREGNVRGIRGCNDRSRSACILSEHYQYV